MTFESINSMIESIGVEYEYYQFPEGTAVAPPFICFYYPGQEGFFADNVNYARQERLIIELYTKEKDFELEDKVRDVLNENEIPFVRFESYIDSEKLYMNTFESEVFIDG